MENQKNLKRFTKLTALTLASALAFSSAVIADDNPEDDKVSDKTVEKELNQVEQEGKKRLEKRRGWRRYKKVTLSDDKSYYTIDGKEELGPNPVDGETFYVRYDKKKYQGTDDSYEDDDSVHHHFRHINDRDGFYLAYSAVSSSGDNFYQVDEQSDTSFDTHFSYRIQLAGLFIESPGLNSRRLHGLYASNAWGINFYNDDNWSFDIYKQFNTKKAEGLADVQNRNLSRRAGIRATGYFDNGQLQFIYSPHSSGGPDEDGIEASLSYTHYWQIKNWNIYGALGAQYQSQEIADYYQPTLIGDQSRLNASAELGFEYPLSEHWVLGAFASYNELPSQRSDIETTATGSRAGLLLSFVF